MLFLPSLAFAALFWGMFLHWISSEEINLFGFRLGYTPIAMLTLVLVVVGTILFISSFLPFVVHISKNNKRKFYTETKIITSPNFIYRMRSNSKTLIAYTVIRSNAYRLQRYGFIFILSNSCCVTYGTVRN